MNISCTKLLHTLTLVCAAVLLPACTINQKQLTTATSEPKHIAIFFDGTNNQEESDTNVKRLHSLMTLQKRPDIATFYVEGVGSEYGAIGMGTGWGFQERVKPAYQFLLDNYKPDDKIYIFGFSRGAFSARVLTSLLYHAGLPQHAKLPSSEVAEIVFDTVKHARANEPGWRQEVRKQLKDEHALILANGNDNINVEILGLWDTVEALGFPDWGARIAHKMRIKPYAIDIDIPNTLYGDQLCNVRRAFHALSVDDNREWIFTPLLLGRNALFSKCGNAGAMQNPDGGIIPGRLVEVWFPGAHSDVGGGYHDSMMSGLSLNWMIGQIAKAQAEEEAQAAADPGKATGPREPILAPHAAVNEDAFGRSHDPEAGIFGPIYHNINRNIGAYLTDRTRHREEFVDTMCVHKSVIERRRTVALKAHENHYLDLRREGEVCLEDTGEFATPPILKQVSCTGKDERKLVVQVWPHCKDRKTP